VEKLGPEHPPIIAGIWPIHSQRQVTFVHERIVALPEGVLASLQAAGSAVEDQGRELAHSLLRQVIPLVQGVYFVPSFGRMEGIPELIDAARDLSRK
jgi:homocysteine S-methyltransferase